MGRTVYNGYILAKPAVKEIKNFGLASITTDSEKGEVRKLVVIETSEKWKDDFPKDTVIYVPEGASIKYTEGKDLLYIVKGEYVLFKEDEMEEGC